MKIQIRFSKEEGGLESFYDKIEIVTGSCLDAESWADAMLDIIRASQRLRTAIVANMLDVVSENDSRWSTKSIELVRESLARIESKASDQKSESK
jgi:hypothetical protein